MFVRVIRRTALQKLMIGLLFAAAAALLLCRPQAVATGVSRGLSVCTRIIIPTLYPFMLLAALLAGSPLCRAPGRLADAVTRRLFGLPGCCGPAILIALVGGYPAGAVAISRLREQEQITRQQARQMSRFCVNGGPGFIIGTVGSGLLGSAQAGVLLFAAHAAVSVAVGIWLGHRARGKAERAPRRAAGVPPAAEHGGIAAAVGSTCGALLQLCGFVVLASAVLSLLDGSGIAPALARLTGLSPQALRSATAALLEVSSGCIALSGSGALAPFWLSLCIGFGGLSVHGQIAALLGGDGIPDRMFFLFRVFHGVASGGLALLLFRLFPAADTAASASAPIGGGIAPVSTSLSASLALLVFTFAVMLCLPIGRPSDLQKKD